MGERICENKDSKDLIITFPAGGTFNSIYECQIYFRIAGKRYRKAKYVGFRNNEGVIEKIYTCEMIQTLNRLDGDYDNIDNLDLSVVVKNRMKEYIEKVSDSSEHKVAHDFYILREEKNFSNGYFKLKKNGVYAKYITLEEYIN